MLGQAVFWTERHIGAGGGAVPRSSTLASMCEVGALLTLFAVHIMESLKSTRMKRGRLCTLFPTYTPTHVISPTRPFTGLGSTTVTARCSAVVLQMLDTGRGSQQQYDNMIILALSCHNYTYRTVVELCYTPRTPFVLSYLSYRLVGSSLPLLMILPEAVSNA